MPQKRRDSRGFTLVEMLIVVAVIAILVAVSIPLVSTSLEKARCATDAANERAAKMVAAVAYLEREVTAVDLSDLNTTNNIYLYDAESGAYYKYGEQPDPYERYGKCDEHKDKAIWFKVTTDGSIHLVWKENVGGATSLNDWDQNLCITKLGG